MVDFTVGGINSNSYVSPTELEAYMEIHPYYSTLVIPDEDSILAYSNIMLEIMVTWRGDKADESQSLHFPTWGTSVIPKEIKYAQMELAFHLLNSPSLTNGGEFKSIELGDVKLDMNDSPAGTTEMLPPIVASLISQYGAVKSSGIRTLSTIEVVRS